MMKSSSCPKVLTSSVLSLSLALGLVGCDGFQTPSRDAQFENTRILAKEVRIVSDLNDVEMQDIGGTDDQPAPPTTVGGEVRIIRECSNRVTAERNFINLRVATTMRVTVRSNTGVSCTVSELREKNNILTRGKLNLERCILPDGRYNLKVEGARDLSSNVYNPDVTQQMRFETLGSGEIEVRNQQIAAGQIRVLVDLNKEDSRYQDYLRILSDPNRYSLNQVYDLMATAEDLPEQPPTQCEDSHSPLAIQLNPAIALKFTNRNPGVMFDLLGWNALPQPFTRIRISWLEQPESHAFLVLPDNNGEVRGIQELFGNNTKGPDGRFSHNGFMALAKYDGLSLDGKTRGPADDLINSADGVFAKLRLWQDLNSDGVAQKGEFVNNTLSSKGIVAINLNYNPRYREIDSLYGNEVKFRSRVVLNNGNYLNIYDIWFKQD